MKSKVDVEKNKACFISNSSLYLNTMIANTFHEGDKVIFIPGPLAGEIVSIYTLPEKILRDLELEEEYPILLYKIKTLEGNYITTTDETHIEHLIPNRKTDNY